jgi:hypothetical protein
MGLLDQLGQAAAGMMGGGDKSPLMQAVVNLLGQNSSPRGAEWTRAGVSEERPGRYRQFLGQYRKEPPGLGGADPAGPWRRPPEATGISSGIEL